MHPSSHLRLEFEGSEVKVCSILIKEEKSHSEWPVESVGSKIFGTGPDGLEWDFPSLILILEIFWLLDWW